MIVEDGEMRRRILRATLGVDAAEARKYARDEYAMGQRMAKAAADAGEDGRTTANSDMDRGGATSCEALLEAARRGLGFQGAVNRLVLYGEPHKLHTCRTERNSQSAIHLAALRGDDAGVEAVARNSAHGRFDKRAIDDVDAAGATPLHLAAWRGHVPVVDTLLRLGADAHATDMYGVTPLHKAVGHGRFHAAARLASDGGVDVNVKCESVIRAPPEQKAQPSLAMTPLHIACRRQVDGADVAADAPMIRMLLHYGADPNRRDARGRTPIHYSACACDVRAITLLLRAGSNASVTDHAGATPGDLLPEGCGVRTLEGYPPPEANEPLGAQLMPGVNRMHSSVEALMEAAAAQARRRAAEGAA